MPSLRSALTALVLMFSAHGALAMGPVPSGALLHADGDRRPPAWTAVRMCNGISKATRTICCGTNPPAWCGKRPDKNDIDDALLAEPNTDIMLIVSDPMFYICLITSVTVIYLAALAGSGRDNDLPGGA